MTRRLSSACRSSIDDDHPSHSGSSVTTSRSTLLSTSVGTSLLSRQREDFDGGQPTSGAAAGAGDQACAPCARLPRLADAHAVAIDLELDLAVGEQPQALADVLRD